MLGLGTVDGDGLSVGDGDLEGGLSGGAGRNGHESRVELAAGLASLVGATSGDSVVLVEELEVDSITGSGLDRGWGEGELLVSSNLDVKGGTKGQRGLEKSNEGGLGEHVGGW